MTLPICPHCHQPFPMVMRVRNPREITKREMQVWYLVSLDKTNTEIGKTLCIEIGTVKTHLHSILRKLGVKNRRQAARRYIEASKE